MVTLGDFPDMHANTALRGFEDFNKPYVVHCREVRTKWAAFDDVM